MQSRARASDEGRAPFSHWWQQGGQDWLRPADPLRRAGSLRLPEPASTQLERNPMNGVLRARSALLAGSMILGPICILLGHLLNVNSSEAPAQYVRDVSAHHAAFIAGSVVLSAGAFLLIPAMIGAMRLAPGRGGALVTIGGLLASIAAAGLGAGTLMLGAVIGMLTPAHSDLAIQVDQIGNHSSIGALPFLLAPGLIVGLLLVAVGLYRARLAHRWPAIVLAIAVGPLLVAPSGGVLGAALHLPLCVAITGLGLELWRHSAAESEGSPALPHHEPHPAQA